MDKIRRSSKIKLILKYCLNGLKQKFWSSLSSFWTPHYFWDERCIGCSIAWLCRFSLFDYCIRNLRPLLFIEDIGMQSDTYIKIFLNKPFVKKEIVLAKFINLQSSKNLIHVHIYSTALCDSGGFFKDIFEISVIYKFVKLN